MAGWEMMTFNIKDGYLEAIVRGYKSGLLSAADYNNLCQCESLDDIKLNLTGTDYGGFLQNGTLSAHVLTLEARLYTFHRSSTSADFNLKLGGARHGTLCAATAPACSHRTGVNLERNSV